MHDFSCLTGTEPYLQRIKHSTVG